MQVLQGVAQRGRMAEISRNGVTGPRDGFNVLAVDDDADVLDMLSHLLRKENASVFPASSVAEALSIIDNEPLDMAVIDIIMPGADGTEICRHLRQVSQNADAYVIFLSARRAPEERVAGLDLGADDYIAKPFELSELAARIRAGRRVIDARNELKARNRILAELAVTDELTRLYNRRFFDQSLGVEFERGRRYERALTLLLADIDHFKRINDSFGHPAGDVVLANVAQEIAGGIRKSDTAARFGGEEFAILLPEIQGAPGLAVAEKIRVRIAESTVEAEGNQLNVTVSIGVASFDGFNRTSPADLLRAADRAMYAAKNGGRNRVVTDRM